MPKRKNKSQYKSPTSLEMWKKQRPSPALSENEQMELSTLFGKHFKYSQLTSHLGKSTTPSTSNEVSQKHQTHRVEDYCLLTEEDTLLDWQDEDLMSLKKEMNDLKSQLSDMDIIKWHAHTTACNLAGKIIPYVRTLHVELCTQAWVKFYEILSAFRIVPDANFYSMHLCEAPGAFIAALNHHLQQQAFPHSWDWRATTLNPYYEGNSLDEMIADDRLFRHTYAHCYFGPDGSGDIRAKGHIAGIHDMAKDLEKDGSAKILLVTADGSRDCQVNPAEQESLLSQLHYSEMLAACLILAEGGNFVLKVFTMFETSTVSLLFLLNIMFEEVHAFKPATSKGGNSETYLICLNYQKNVADETLWQMLAAVLDSNITCFIRPSELPAKFLEEHRSCCQNFAHWQGSTIRRNMRLSELGDQEAFQEVESLQDAAVDMFIERTNMMHSRHFKRLITSHWETSSFTAFKSNIPHGIEHHQTRGFQGHHKDLRGTFHLRQNLNSLNFHDRITLMTMKDDSPPDTLLMIRCFLEEREVKDLLCMEKAHRFDVIKSSQLCTAELLTDLNTMFRHSEILECRAKSQQSHVRYLAELLVNTLTRCNDGEKFDQEEVCRSDHAVSPVPQGQRRLSNSEDLAAKTLRPEWNTPSSPSKIPFSHGSESEEASEPSGLDSISSRPVSPQESTCYWVTEGHQEKDSEFAKILEEFLSPKSINICLVKLTENAEKMKDLERGSYFFMDLIPLSHPENATLNHMELNSKKTCINKLAWALQYMPVGSSLVLLTTTLLTRFSAGFVYLLARCFQKTTVESSPNLWLHQFLVLENFQGISDTVIRHMANVRSVLEEEGQATNSKYTLVEFVRFHPILNDRKFVQFLTSYNNFLLASFINLILRHFGPS